MKIVAIWTADGALIGTAITGAIKNKQMEKAVKVAQSKGYLEGTLDAYKELARDPYFQMDNSMRKLEQQGKAKKF